MSASLITRSPDLYRLEGDGYDIEVISNRHLLLKGVPYVTKERIVERGVIVSELELRMGPEGEVTKKPNSHIVKFIGQKPCDQDGRPLASVIEEGEIEIEVGLTTNFAISQNPSDGKGYVDFYDKMITYYLYLSGPAEVVADRTSP